MSTPQASRGAGPDPGAAPRVGGYAWYVLGVFVLVTTFNTADRYILSILLPDIKSEFALSDAMLGFLVGPAFAVCHTLAGLPIARFADRGVRRSIVAGGLFREFRLEGLERRVGAILVDVADRHDVLVAHALHGGTTAAAGADDGNVEALAGRRGAGRLGAEDGGKREGAGGRRGLEEGAAGGGGFHGGVGS